MADFEVINMKTKHIVRTLRNVRSTKPIPGGQRIFFDFGSCKVKDIYELRRIREKR